MFLSLAYTSARHACTHLAFVEGEFCSVENVLRKTSRNELPTDHGKIVSGGRFFRFLYLSIHPRIIRSKHYSVLLSDSSLGVCFILTAH
mmetsp:Transcript_3839/g.5543  ORF Transcript_3839/g.5543 Transcript_3839/m.5543 type:complete len:89 (+) Transcript_3839:599-865(+)